MALRDMLFVHWPLAPKAVRHLFTEATRPDTFGGRTYVGIVGFTVPSIRLGSAVAIGSMAELNVRLYSVDTAGRHGVLFRSMHVTRPDTVLAARLMSRLPFRWSRVRPYHLGPAVRGIQVVARQPSELDATVEVEIGEMLPRPSALDLFLTARWGLHTRTVAGPTWVPISHAPFVLHRARLRHADHTLLAFAGVPLPVDDDAVGVLWSPGLDVQIGGPHRMAD